MAKNLCIMLGANYICGEAGRLFRVCFGGLVGRLNRGADVPFGDVSEDLIRAWIPA